MSTSGYNNIDNLLEQIFSDKDEPIDLNILFQEKLLEYDLSQRKVLGLLNIDQRTLEDTLNGTSKQPNIINLLKIANFLGIDDLYKAIPAILKNQEKENIASIERGTKAAFVAKNFDIKKLNQIGFFTETDDTDYLTKRILSFFNFNSIFEFEREVTKPLLSKTKRTHSDKMKNFWISSASECFKKINNPNPYERNLLKDIIVKIRPYSQDVEDGLFTVCKALYNVGVTVIVQNHLTLTQVRGGTFFINNKPCIVLTDLNKRYTTIWETLIHEIHHVLYDLETISGGYGFHLTGEPDLFLIEEKAENFSREYFCGFEDYKRFKTHINSPFLIQKFAKDIEVHPSFIYSSFRHFQQAINKKNYYGAFIEFFPDYSLCIKNLSPITWKENSINEIAEKLKSIFELNV